MFGEYSDNFYIPLDFLLRLMGNAGSPELRNNGSQSQHGKSLIFILSADASNVVTFFIE